MPRLLALAFLLALAAASPSPAAQPERPSFAMVGYATVDALGVAGTTGGSGGTEVTVTTGQELRDAIYNNRSNEPLTIYVEGMLTYTAEEKIYVKERSNISIIGVGSDAGLDHVGLAIVRASNVVVRNLTIRYVDRGDKDAILINASHHIWVDHCDLHSDRDHGKDYYDGLVDINHGSDYVTVSWTRFHDHYKTSLVGNSDNTGDEDQGHLTVTYHHNGFERTNSRLPSVRFGSAHVFNNLYEDAETAISSRMGACVRVEANAFSDVRTPILTDQSRATGAVDLLDNDFGGVSVVTTPACVLDVPYVYDDVLQTAADAAEAIRQYAGVGQIGARATAAEAPPAGLALRVGPNPTAGPAALWLTPRPSPCPPTWSTCSAGACEPSSRPRRWRPERTASRSISAASRPASTASSPASGAAWRPAG